MSDCSGVAVFLKGLVIVIGSLLLAMGINFFLVPYKVFDGGIIGIGLIVKYLWGLDAGLSIIILSIHIFILAWFRYKDYFYNSLHGMLVSSILIDVVKPFDALLPTDAAFSSIIGGLFVGLGIGIMLKFRTSTGGTDLLAQFLSDKTGVNVGILIFAIDFIVIIMGGFLFSAETLFLSITVGLTTSLFTRRIAEV